MNRTGCILGDTASDFTGHGFIYSLPIVMIWIVTNVSKSFPWEYKALPDRLVGVYDAWGNISIKEFDYVNQTPETNPNGGKHTYES